MTSLAKQLERLKLPGAHSRLGRDTSRTSLLFDPKEAANEDRLSVYHFGMMSIKCNITVDSCCRRYHFLWAQICVVGHEMIATKYGSHFGDISECFSCNCLQRVHIAYNATAVIAMALSAVRLSVTFRYCVETNECTFMRFLLSGSKIILVYGEIKIIWKFAGDHTQQGH